MSLPGIPISVRNTVICPMDRKEGLLRLLDEDGIDVFRGLTPRDGHLNIIVAQLLERAAETRRRVDDDNLPSVVAVLPERSVVAVLSDQDNCSRVGHLLHVPADILAGIEVIQVRGNHLHVTVLELFWIIGEK